eukprot:2484656-Rhodomonas_salina.1
MASEGSDDVDFEQGDAVSVQSEDVDFEEQDPAMGSGTVVRMANTGTGTASLCARHVMYSTDISHGSARGRCSKGAGRPAASEDVSPASARGAGGSSGG